MNEVFKVLAIIVSVIIIYYFPQVPRQDFYLRLPMAMQLGGAVGNLIDRFRDGYVTDFVSVGTFAVFNVADASISVGVALLFLSIFWRDWQAKKHAGQETESTISDEPRAPAMAEMEPEQTLPEPQPEKAD
jgi:signal peptidase II